MERFIGTDTASVELFFNLLNSWNWDIFHTVGPNFVSCVAEVCRLGLESLWHSSPPLCHSEDADADRKKFLEAYEKMEITGSEVLAKGWMMIKHLPAELLQEMCWQLRRAVCGHRLGTADNDFDRRSVHSKTLSQTGLHSRHVLEQEPPSPTTATMLQWELGKSR